MVDPIFNTKEGEKKGSRITGGECTICTKLNIPNIIHNTANCFANIRDNPNFKPRIYATRLEQAQKAGLVIPELYPKLDEEGKPVG